MKKTFLSNVCFFFTPFSLILLFFSVPIIPSNITTKTINPLTTAGRNTTDEYLITTGIKEDSTISYTKINPPRNLPIPVTTHVEQLKK